MSGHPPLQSHDREQFDVIYAGLIPDICVDSIDPSGRTDLLRIIDKAKLSGDVCPSSPVGDPRCQLILEQYSIRLLNSRTQELLLCCPVEQLVSVGYVREMNHHILPLVIGHSADEGTSHDLALLYAPDKVTSLLSQNELREFATLLQRWQDGALPVRELALKLMELYGPERRHLLARLRLLLRGDDLETLHEFLDIHGITECAGSDSSAGFRSDARSGGTE